MHRANAKVKRAREAEIQAGKTWACVYQQGKICHPELHNNIMFAMHIHFQGNPHARYIFK